MSTLYNHICFVSHDDRCHSPIAMMILRSLLLKKSHVQVESSGLSLIASSGQRIPRLIKPALNRMKIPWVPYRSKPMTTSRFFDQDLILVFTEREFHTMKTYADHHAKPIRLLPHIKPLQFFQSIPDPLFQFPQPTDQSRIDDYLTISESIYDCCKNIARYIQLHS